MKKAGWQMDYTILFDQPSMTNHMVQFKAFDRFFKYPNLALIPTSMAELIFYNLHIRNCLGQATIVAILCSIREKDILMSRMYRTRVSKEQAPQADALAITKWQYCYKVGFVA